MPRQRQHCVHCVEGQPYICNYCGKASYHPVQEAIATRSTRPPQRNHLEVPLYHIDRDIMDAAALQQVLAALTVVVQAQQQAQQQQQQVQQQQGQALQIALQAIQHNQNAVVSHPLPTFSGTVDEDVYRWLENF